MSGHTFHPGTAGHTALMGVFRGDSHNHYEFADMLEEEGHPRLSHAIQQGDIVPDPVSQIDPNQPISVWTHNRISGIRPAANHVVHTVYQGKFDPRGEIRLPLHSHIYDEGDDWRNIRLSPNYHAEIIRPTIDPLRPIVRLFHSGNLFEALRTIRHPEVSAAADKFLSVPPEQVNDEHINEFKKSMRLLRGKNK